MLNCWKSPVCISISDFIMRVHCCVAGAMKTGPGDSTNVTLRQTFPSTEGKLYYFPSAHPNSISFAKWGVVTESYGLPWGINRIMHLDGQ